MIPEQRIADYLEYMDVYRMKHRVDPSEFTRGLLRWRDALLRGESAPQPAAVVARRRTPIPA